jgi:hypothetical protein
MTCDRWMGRPIDELTREELLDVVEYCRKEIQRLQEDRDRWRNSGSSLAYLAESYFKDIK